MSERLRLFDPNDPIDAACDEARRAFAAIAMAQHKANRADGFRTAVLGTMVGMAELVLSGFDDDAQKAREVMVEVVDVALWQETRAPMPEGRA